MASEIKPSYATFEDLPREVSLYDGSSGLPVAAKYIKLTKSDIREKVDKIWWARLTLLRDIKRGEPDFNWNWVTKFGEVRADAQGYMQAWGVETTNDGEVQGVILYRTDSSSIIDEDLDGEPLPAVWVSYLATAPWNRDWLTLPRSAKYSGVGTALIRMAIANSYFRQGGGRINLSSVEHPRTFNWYLKKGFVRCGVSSGDTTLLELPEAVARRHLKKWGLT